MLWLIIALIGRISSPLPWFFVAEIDQEHRQPVAAPLHLIHRRGARQQQHHVGIQRARGPHLLPGHQIGIAVAHRACLQLRGVRSGGRLGHAERLQPDAAGGDLRQIAALLCLAAVPQQRAHDVHLRVALAGGAAAGIDLLQDHRRRAHRQAGAAVFLRDQRAEEPGLRQLGDEFGRIRLLVFQALPICAGIARADSPHGIAQLGKILADRDHGDVRHDAALQSCPRRTLPKRQPAVKPDARATSSRLLSTVAMRILFITSNRLGDAVLSTGLLDHLIRTHPDARITVACGPVAEGVFARMPNRERTIVLDKRPYRLHWPRPVVRHRDDTVGPGGGHPRLGLRLDGADASPRGHASPLGSQDRAARGGAAARSAATAGGLDGAGGSRPCRRPAAGGSAHRGAGADRQLAAEDLAGGTILPRCSRRCVMARCQARSRRSSPARARRNVRWPRRCCALCRTRSTWRDGSSVPEAAACLARAALFVGNDSGLMHLAAAAGAPTLGLFGPTDAAEYAPSGRRAAATAATTRQMQDLTVAQVLAAATALLAG